MAGVSAIFKNCVDAIRDGKLIHRESRVDKEFDFQDWFKHQLDRMEIKYDSPARNTYPDFRLVHKPEGYELKGLAYPGREADYDSNSQVPSGEHNGRAVYYVFGRYPKNPDGNDFPILDFVICHGSFLNASNSYIHKNKSFRGFGTFGDILVRDRKMYVCPTPFALVKGAAHRRTLILPEQHPVDFNLVEIASLVRREVECMTVAYTFDLRTNELDTTKVPNPQAGRKHKFKAYRVSYDPVDSVSLNENI